MPITIDKTSAEPTYLQLAAELRRLIAGRELPVDEESGKMMLPSLYELVDSTGLSHSTIQRAVRLLKDEGLVVTAPGRGVFVC